MKSWGVNLADSEADISVPSRAETGNEEGSSGRRVKWLNLERWVGLDLAPYGPSRSMNLILWEKEPL